MQNPVLGEFRRMIMARYFERTWRNKYLTTDATTIDDMIHGLQEAVEELRTMKAAGVTLVNDGGTEDDQALLVTEDPKVARRFGFGAVEGETKG
jgi:hypothetical protein